MTLDVLLSCTALRSKDSHEEFRFDLLLSLFFHVYFKGEKKDSATTSLSWKNSLSLDFFVAMSGDIFVYHWLGIYYMRRWFRSAF